MKHTKESSRIPVGRAHSRVGATFAVASILLAPFVWPGCGGETATTSGRTAAGGVGGGGAGCGPGNTLCGDTCTNTAIDPANCGYCGHPCPAGELCVAAQCSSACGGGTTACGDLCVDTKNDPANCGACGTACAAGEVCSMGACGLTCLGGSTKCGDACVNTANDPNNCGACGTACAAGEVCSAGACGLACAGGTTKCGNACVNTANDPANCGACGTACAAGDVCSMGACSFSCAGGTTKCGNACVNTTNDPSNCGACGNACAAGEVCSAGACAFSCAGGTTKCGNACVDVKNDPSNCGACGNACAQPGAVPLCSNGVCGPLACLPGFANCNNNAADGCEVNLATSAANCGACGVACNGTNGTPVCAAGACAAPICNNGYGNCDGNAANGCEVTFATNPANCGMCGVTCNGINGTPVCAGGVCGAPLCNMGFANCDGNIATGCEANTTTDAANCGACGAACAGGVSCAGGSCGVALQNQILYNGYYYATLDDAPPAAQYGTWVNNCQTNPLPVPLGWSLVPEDPSIVTNIIMPNIFSTHCILFANGVSYGVSTYNNGGACGCSGNQCMTQNGSLYSVTSCSRRILIRRPM